MRQRRVWSALALLLTAAPVAAQLRPDIIYTDRTNDSIIRLVDVNRNGTYGDPGEYTIMHSRAAFTSQVQAVRVVNSGQTVLWCEWDGGSPTGATNGIYRADLVTGLGRINHSEATFVYNLQSPDDVAYDAATNTIYAVNDYTPNMGLWALKDLNNDNDAMDPGEATLLVANALNITVPGTLGSVQIGGDDFEALTIDSQGYILAFEQTDEVVYRFKDLNNDGDVADAGEAINFLNYGSQNRVGLAVNPDFLSGQIPKLAGIQYANLEMLDVEPTPAGDVYYFGVYFGPSTTLNNRLGHIYRGFDTNKNGHLNDAGEVNLFYDGLQGLAIPVTLGEGMSYEPTTNSVFLQDANFSGGNNDRVIELIDLNLDGDALDNNEQAVVYTDMAQPYSEFMVTVQPGLIPNPNSTRGQTRANGSLKSGQPVTFTLRDVPTTDNGGTGYVALSLTGDGRNTNGIPLNDGPNRRIGLDFDSLLVLTQTALQPFFVTSTISAQSGTTQAFLIPAGIPVGLRLWASGVVVTPSNTFGAITDTFTFTIQP